jgi:lipoprotein-anchoring transpeptidase ErfK/SrfK
VFGGAGLVLGLPALTAAIMVGIHTLSPSPRSQAPAAIPSTPRSSPASPTGRPLRACAVPSLIGTVTVPHLAARRAPSAHAPTVATFGPRNVEGGPQVFLIESAARGGRWLKALLPMRPNGTVGYIPAHSIKLSKTWYRIDVSRSKYRLTLWKGCHRVTTYPVGIGTGRTQTPVGRFYLEVLLKPPDPNTVYGIYAYGLSAFSNTIRNWEWGGVIGLHGTNEPSSIGHRSSHGCIRMLNRDIAKLVPLLPLGTPITIT